MINENFKSQTLSKREDRGNVVIVLLLLMVAWFIVVNLQSWILDVKDERMHGKGKQAELALKRKNQYADRAEAVKIYQNPYEKVSR